MQHHGLNRQEKGKLAEHIARGLHQDPHDQLIEVVREDVRDRYSNLVADANVWVSNIDVDCRSWTDVLPVCATEDIGWRPDFFLEASWVRRFDPDEIPEPDFWTSDIPPFYLKTSFGRRRPHAPLQERLHCCFRAYYPVEVKSGRKKTLTERQASAIPRIVDEVDHVHLIIATVDIEELPESYAIDIVAFSSSDWSDDGETRRYQS